MSHDENTLAQALDTINGTYVVIGIKRGTFVHVLRRKQVDIVVNSVGITRDRHRLFAFTANKFGQAVFYVKKTWKHNTDLFSFGGLPLMLLSALSMLLSAGCIIFFNIHRGRQPSNGLGDVVLALMATTLAFSSPLPNDHTRSTLIRLVIASWMLTCLSLVSYTRSLLIARLMAGPRWEADDSLDEIMPKLQKGLLLPCAEADSFFDVVLTRAAGNGHGVIDAMASASRHWARSRRDFTGTFQSCVERTKKGTHVFFTDSIDPCRFLRFEKVIARGKKPVNSLIGGFPVRRDFLLQSELISVVHRIFETGWEIRLERLAERNCSGFVEDEEMLLRAHAGYLFHAFSISVPPKRMDPISSRRISRAATLKQQQTRHHGNVERCAEIIVACHCSHDSTVKPESSEPTLPSTGGVVRTDDEKAREISRAARSLETVVT
ncbi:hypothetical protein MRX96_043641 [Rhipicephalus microplus]